MEEIKAIILDLDGTLLDTLDDLTYSFNIACTNFGCKALSKNEYRQLIGNGAKKVIISVLNKNGVFDVATYNQCYSLFRKTYRSTEYKRTIPYKGITELLDFLIQKDMIIAVFSNKPHEDTVRAVDHCFPSIKFKVVLGHKVSNPLKPSPVTTNQLLSELQTNAKNTLLIGDSEVDIQTGKNVGILTIAVTWGFREINQLEICAPYKIFNNPEQIIDFLDND